MSLNPATVHVSDEGILVTTGGMEAVTRTFAQPGDAARFLALDIWRDRGFWPSRSRNDPAFDWEAFSALVEVEMDALRATNGWRIEGTVGDYTIWALPGREMFSRDVTDLAYQATKGEVPSSDGGFRRLDSLLRAKNVPPHAMVAVSGADRDVRAVQEPDGHVWRGFHRDGAGWVPATDDAGAALAYADPSDARAGALALLGRAGAPATSPSP